MEQKETPLADIEVGITDLFASDTFYVYGDVYLCVHRGFLQVFFPFNPILVLVTLFLCVCHSLFVQREAVRSCEGGVNIPLGLYDSCVAAHCSEMSHDVTW